MRRWGGEESEFSFRLLMRVNSCWSFPEVPSTKLWTRSFYGGGVCDHTVRFDTVT